MARNKRRSPRIRKRTKRKIAFYIILILTIALYILVFNLKKFTITGTDRYDAEEIKSYIVNYFWKNNTLYLKLENMLKKNYKIPYIDSVKINMHSNKEVVAEVVEKNIIYQLEVKNAKNKIIAKYLDLSDELTIEGENKKLDNNKILITKILNNDTDDEEFSSDRSLSKEDIDFIKIINNQFNENNITGINNYIIDKDEYKLKNKNITVELGTIEDMDKKIKEFINIFPSIKTEKGILYLEKYDIENKGYRFKKSSR